MSEEYLSNDSSQRNSFDSNDVSRNSQEEGAAGSFNSNTSRVTFDQVFLTYKFLLTPLPLLVKGMCKKNE